jgi:hypothetical protein
MRPAPPPAGQRRSDKRHLCWRACLAVWLLIVLLPAMACTGQDGGPPVVRANDPGAASAPPEPPLVATSLFAKAATAIEPAWSLTFDRPVTAALADAGSYLLLGRSYGPVRRSTHWGALAYDVATGQQLWSKSYGATSYRTIQVSALGPQPWFAVAVYTYGNSGTLHVYGLNGKTAWTRQVVSSTLLSADGEGSRIYGVDHGRGSIFVADSATGREYGTVSGETGTSLQVAQNGRALGYTGSSLILISAEGKVVARVPAQHEFADVEFAATGDGVFASTGGSSSTVYRFDAKGQMVWQRKIQCGGSNSLSVSPDGSRVMAYNVGIEHGLTLIDASDGTVIRRNSFALVENAKSQFVRGVYFLADGGHLIDYVISRDRANGHEEERFLVRLDADGQLGGRMDLGSNIDVLLSGDCSVCVTVDNLLVEAGGVNRVRVYDIRPLLGPK